MKILVAVLAYNEEENIFETLTDLIHHNFGYDIVVIDDGSTDGTKEICDGLNIPTISHCVNAGSFGAVKTYFMYAFQCQYDIVCQFDGDGQHIAEELPKIIEPIERHGADYVIGSRFIHNEGFQSSLIRRLGIRIFSAILSFITDQKISDSTSGFRSYNKKMIKFFSVVFQHQIQDTNQLLLLAKHQGAKIHEVPVVMRERRYGKSEFDMFSSILFFLYGLISILGCILQSKIRSKSN